MANHPARRLAAAIACALVAPSCARNPPFPPYEGPDTCVRYRTLNIPQNVWLPQIDLLFVIENTPRMAALAPPVSTRIQATLRSAQLLADKGTYYDLHIGVVTTDMGAGATGSDHCEPAHAQPRGALQPVGAAAPRSCRGPVDANWIRYQFDRDRRDPDNLPAGQSLADTLECMAAVGDGGCEYPQPLEAAYAALQSDVNRGFLRDTAVLGVVFITAQEDCSAPPDTDLFDPRITRHGPPGNYRCSRAGVGCPGPLPADGRTSGPVHGCAPLAEPPMDEVGRLHPVRRYRSFFELPRVQGGVKDSPLDVVLMSASAPVTPYAPFAAGPGSTPEHPVYCDANSTCIPEINPSCTAGDFRALPSVRLDSVVGGVKQFDRISVCDPDWTPATVNAFPFITGHYGFGCFRESLRDPRDPDCVATDVTLHPDGTEVRTRLPRCGPDANDSPVPCWEFIARPECAPPVSPQGISFQVRRDHEGAPPHTSTMLECALPCTPPGP